MEISSHLFYPKTQQMYIILLQWGFSFVCYLWLRIVISYQNSSTADNYIVSVTHLVIFIAVFPEPRSIQYKSFEVLLSASHDVYSTTMKHLGQGPRKVAPLEMLWLSMDLGDVMILCGALVSYQWLSKMELGLQDVYKSLCQSS